MRHAGRTSEAGVEADVDFIVGTISNLLDLHLDYQVPEYSELPLQEWLNRRDGLSSVLLVRSTISVENHPIEGELMLCLNSGSAEEFVRRLQQA